MRNLFILFTLCVAFISCKGGSEEKYKVSEAAMVLPPPASSKDRYVVNADYKNSPETTDQQHPRDTSQKIIKEGEISFETGNIRNTRKTLTDSLKHLGGYVDEESETNSGGEARKNYTLKVRVPAQNFDKLLSAISSAADRIESKSIRIKDVTTEFIDITSRLNNKHLLENRYKELLQKATKMSDMLEVENKLTEIRTDIETTQGQLNYLNKQITFSSLDITFFTESVQSTGDGNGFGYKLKSALVSGWGTLQGIFFGLIALWPVLMIVIILTWLYRKWRRRKAALRAS